MPRPDLEQPLVPSVLDRLVDLEPKISTEPPASRSRSPVQVKEAVKRDLEWLLNSKQTLGAFFPRQAFNTVNGHPGQFRMPACHSRVIRVTRVIRACHSCQI
jgi:predicted component of type VI protein secretion system